ncbi:adenylyl-sulfate kinase [Desulfuromonas versatilis]|uniref:Multifunctional fusion protein n=1 Tax=Desulfuromonas versatilis TaxID=2802975 RepID=A0ABM8HY84_9BACT|nr:sulfate adenylyltransferase subunit CysN [Desulfuromonas versatilis]BCR05498.1 adenylyl-sulfate kinase [Desulfuromonas versatilis]
MAHQSDLIARDIHAYLKSQEEKGMLRFITCGSVDDGKSTLIGRLLWDSKMVFEDQLAALEADSKRVGTQGENIDYALLLDGLQAEREQGITIDVAYRFFSTDKRKFIVADTPGHEQYTRNMVTGASTAQVAVILIDARKGVLTQTKRHSYLVSLVGIRHVVLAINKMDLVDYSAERFEQIRAEYEAFAEGLGFEQIAPIPISALEGANVLVRSDSTPWYGGPTLMEYLETVQVADASAGKPFRMRVQWVNRPNLDFRGFCGTIASGSIRPGDEVAVTSSGKTSKVARIVTMDGDLDQAAAGQAVTLTLSDEIDISRGDTLATPENRPFHTDQFEAKIVWLHEEALLPGRSYLIKAGSSTAPAQVSDLHFKVNVNTLQHEPGKTLALNEVGVCSLSVSKGISFDPYGDNRGMGNFILIDRFTNATVGAGMIDAPLQRAAGEDWHAIEINKTARAVLKGQRPKVLWFTGLPGAGKSTLAALVEKKLHSHGKHTYILDGDQLRHGLNHDLGYSDPDQVEHIRRVAEVSKLFVDAGLIVLASVTSPFRSERATAREILEPGEFVEIYVDTPLEVCEARDTTGLYQKARAGELKDVTGIDAIYEPPENPEITVHGAQGAPEELAEKLVHELYRLTGCDAAPLTFEGTAGI